MDEPPTTPERRKRPKLYQHHDTPTKAGIRSVVDYLDSHGIKHPKEQVFKHFGVSITQGYDILNDITSRRHHNNPESSESRGRKTIITREQIKEMERILENEGITGRALTWEQLGMEAGVEASGRTIQRTMQTMDYRKCIACQKGWVSKDMAARRLKFAKVSIF